MSRRVDRVAIPKPCLEQWDDFAGDSRERFCASCQRTVHDLSALTRREAERLLATSRGRLCGRITYDSNGAILFRPDPHARALARLARLSLVGISGWGIASPALAQAADPTQVARSDGSACDVKVKVSDMTTAPVHGAQVTLWPESGGSLVGQDATNDHGLFATQLPPGDYKLRVDSPGFKRDERDIHVSCETEPAPSINVQLQVGATMGVIVIVKPAANPVARLWNRTAALFRRLLHGA